MVWRRLGLKISGNVFLGQVRLNTTVPDRKPIRNGLVKSRGLLFANRPHKWLEIESPSEAVRIALASWRIFELHLLVPFLDGSDHWLLEKVILANRLSIRFLVLQRRERSSPRIVPLVIKRTKVGFVFLFNDVLTCSPFGVLVKSLVLQKV